MNEEVFFEVSSHGYSIPEDGFGFRGKKLRTVPGAEAVIALERQNIAQRLYRITGCGIYRDTVLLGKTAPLAEPLLNAKMTGSDGAQAAVYGGLLYWFWGDTHFPHSPLVNFHVPGAVSSPPEAGGLDPSVGVDLTLLPRCRRCCSRNRPHGR